MIAGEVHLRRTLVAFPNTITGSGTTRVCRTDCLPAQVEPPQDVRFEHLSQRGLRRRGAITVGELEARRGDDRRVCREPERAQDLAAAAVYEAAYMQVATGSTQWCDLAVKLISEMN